MRTVDRVGFTGTTLECGVLIRDLRRRLRSDALDARMDPRDADLLLCDAAGLTLAQLIARDTDELPDDVTRTAVMLVERRLGGEPLQYVRGTTEFYGREYLVDSRVLIPRPETEILVELAIERLRDGDRVIDIGTGSGCIAASIALERPDTNVVALDRSIDALIVARGNFSALGARVTTVLGDVLEPVAGSFDAIVSNPPYIAASDIAGLQREVRDHEPHTALTPGGDGLGVIEQLVSDGLRVLRPAGWMLIEIGYGQSEAVETLAARHGWRVEGIEKDLAGIPRIAVLSR